MIQNFTGSRIGIYEETIVTIHQTNDNTGTFRWPLRFIEIGGVDLCLVEGSLALIRPARRRSLPGQAG